MSELINGVVQATRGTTSDWAASLTPLAEGEVGYNTETGESAVGDGTSLWADLAKAVTVDPATGKLPSTVLTGIASDVEDSSTVIGAAVEAVVAGEQGYDLVILAGQSNMSGRGTPFSATLDPVNARIFQYGDSGTAKNTISPASEPLLMHDTPTGIGPGLQFARWYASRRLATGRNVLLVPVAHGGTPLQSTSASLTWNPSVANNLYASMVTQANAALAAAGTGSKIVAALWIQGETDGDSRVTGADYETVFDTLIGQLRTDLGISDLPFIVGTMVPEYLSTGTRMQINGVHLDTPNRLTQVDVAVSAVGMNMGDGNHFNGPGQRYNGKAMYDAYERVSEGIAPYSVAQLAQVTGVTSSSTTSNSVTLSWNTVSGATSYLVEYHAAGTTTWSSAGTSTSASMTISALAADTVYSFRVSAQNATTGGTASAVVTATTSGGTVSVLGVASAANAYSLRKVADSGYTGNAISVRRSSDDTTTGIGFTSDGDLDTATLLAFAGSGDAFVATWYDQSGNGRDITQATAAAQPQIVASGSVVTSGGKPAVTFDGVDDCLFNSSPALYSAGAATVAQVLSAATASSQLRSWTESVSTVSASQYGLLQPDGLTAATRPLAYPVVTGAFTSSALSPTLPFFDGTIHQASAVDTGAAMSSWVDGAADVSDFAYTRPTSTKNRFTIGGVTRSGSLAPLPMTFSEFVAFGSALSDTDRTTIEANQKSYFGTP